MKHRTHHLAGEVNMEIIDALLWILTKLSIISKDEYDCKNDDYEYFMYLEHDPW